MRKPKRIYIEKILIRTQPSHVRCPEYQPWSCKVKYFRGMSESCSFSEVSLVIRGMTKIPPQTYSLPTLESWNEVARDLISHLKLGDWISLEGEMGVGKTLAVRSCLRAWGYRDPVPSPTFPLCSFTKWSIEALSISMHFASPARSPGTLGVDKRNCLYRVDGKDHFTSRANLGSWRITQSYAEERRLEIIRQ